METAKYEAELQSSAPNNVNKVNQRRKSHKRKKKDVQTAKYCKQCGKTNHEFQICRLKNATCHHSKIKGRIKQVFRKLKSVHSAENECDENVLIVNSLKRDSYNKIVISPTTVWKSVTMEVNTGSAKSIFGSTKLASPDSTLRKHSRAIIQQVGTGNVTVDYKCKAKCLKLCVVKHNGPTLFGRDWLQHIKQDWNELCNVNLIDNFTVGTRLQTLLLYLVMESDM